MGIKNNRCYGCSPEEAGQLDDHSTQNIMVYNKISSMVLFVFKYEFNNYYIWFNIHVVDKMRSLNRHSKHYYYIYLGRSSPWRLLLHTSSIHTVSELCIHFCNIHCIEINVISRIMYIWIIVMGQAINLHLWFQKER